MATPATTKPAKKNANLPLIILLVVIVVAGAGYYWYTTYYQTPAGVTEDNTAPELPVSATDWDKEIFQNPTYTSLKSPIPLPLESGPKGNPAPFLEGPSKQ